MTALSAYILTYDSELYLAAILQKLTGTADELLIVDGGSTDRTLAIAREHDCRVVHRPLTDFREQRNFAQTQCANDMVLFVDSDEIPSGELVQAIASLKERGFGKDAYEVRREWYVLGRKVRAVFPVTSPDYPIRILDRRKVSFDERSRRVHETPFGFTSLGRIEAALHHYTFRSAEELERKLEHYTDIAARDLRERGRKPGLLKVLASPPSAFLEVVPRERRLAGWDAGTHDERLRLSVHPPEIPQGTTLERSAVRAVRPAALRARRRYVVASRSPCGTKRVKSAAFAVASVALPRIGDRRDHAIDEGPSAPSGRVEGRRARPAARRGLPPDRPRPPGLPAAAPRTSRRPNAGRSLRAGRRCPDRGNTSP